MWARSPIFLSRWAIALTLQGLGMPRPPTYPEPRPMPRPIVLALLMSLGLGVLAMTSRADDAPPASLVFVSSDIPDLAERGFTGPPSPASVHGQGLGRQSAVWSWSPVKADVERTRRSTSPRRRRHSKKPRWLTARQGDRSLSIDGSTTLVHQEVNEPDRPRSRSPPSSASRPTLISSLPRPSTSSEARSSRLSRRPTSGERSSGPTRKARTSNRRPRPRPGETAPLPSGSNSSWLSGSGRCRRRRICIPL